MNMGIIKTYSINRLKVCIIMVIRINYLPLLSQTFAVCTCSFFSPELKVCLENGCEQLTSRITFCYQHLDSSS